MTYTDKPYKMESQRKVKQGKGKAEYVKKKAEPTTKLYRRLKKMKLTQTDLYYLIQSDGENFIGRDRISKMVTGKFKNMTLSTVVTVAKALGVKVEDIIDY